MRDQSQGTICKDALIPFTLTPSALCLSLRRLVSLSPTLISSRLGLAASTRPVSAPAPLHYIRPRLASNFPYPPAF